MRKIPTPYKQNYSNATCQELLAYAMLSYMNLYEN